MSIVLVVLVVLVRKEQLLLSSPLVMLSKLVTSSLSFAKPNSKLILRLLIWLGTAVAVTPATVVVVVAAAVAAGVVTVMVDLRPTPLLSVDPASKRSHLVSSRPHRHPSHTETYACHATPVVDTA